MLAESVLGGRPLYPYSVIPGGAYSQTELSRAIQNDPVVAHHYADFQLANTRVIRLNRVELMYVSYRIGTNIFWTKKPLVIPAGETLLTDGKNTARTRCGNRLSASPTAPISPNQPQPEAMNAAPDLSRRALSPAFPQLPRLPPALALIPDGPGRLALPTAELIATPIGAGSSSPLYWPIVGGVSPPSGPVAVVPPALPPPVATPEPNTFALLTIGLAIIAFFFSRKSKLSHRNNAFRNKTLRIIRGAARPWDPLASPDAPE